MLVNTYNFDWKKFLQPYELAVEGFILKIEGIRKQYESRAFIVQLKLYLDE